MHAEATAPPERTRGREARNDRHRKDQKKNRKSGCGKRYFHTQHRRDQRGYRTSCGGEEDTSQEERPEAQAWRTR